MSDANNNLISILPDLPPLFGVKYESPVAPFRDGYLFKIRGKYLYSPLCPFNVTIQWENGYKTNLPPTYAWINGECSFSTSDYVLYRWHQRIYIDSYT